MNSKRIRVVALSLAAAVALYALLGFFAVPYAAKRYLTSFVEHDLGHRLALGDVRFNPFTFKAQVADFDLREPNGGPMLAARHLLIDFEVASLWRRAWSFADIAAQAPHVHVELRPNGQHNFSALLDALRDPKPQPDQPPPRLAIARIAIGEGRVDLADVQAGQTARLALAPITFELTELTTEAADTAPYKLTARSAEGEQIAWNGEISINPAASRGRMVLQGWKLATLARWLGNRIELERADGTLDVSFDYAAAFGGSAPAFTVSNLQARIAELALVNRAAREPFAQLASLQVNGGMFDLAARKFAVESIDMARAAVALEVDANGNVNWSGLVPKAPSPAAATTPAPSPPAQTVASASSPPDAQPWSGRIGRMVVADAAVAYADRRSESAAEIALAGARFETTADATHSSTANAISLTDVKGAIAKLSLRSGAQSIEATDSALNSAGVTAKLGSNGIELDGKTIEATLAKLALGQGDGNWQVGQVSAGLESVRMLTSTDSGTRIEGSGFEVNADSIAARLGKAAKSAIEVGAVNARAHALALEPGAGEPGVRIEGAGGAIQKVLVRDPASGNELARLARAELGGASASTQKRMLSVDKVAVTDAHAAILVAAQGKSNWDGLMAALGADAAEAPEKTKPAAAAPWNVVVSSIELGNLGAGFTDARQEPSLAVELQQVNVRARNANTDRRAKPMQLQVTGRIKDGGQFSATGAVNAQTYATDLKVKLTGLSLLALQPFVARYARVQIVSALASADGRLRYGYQKAAGADLVFEGDVGLDKVIVEETEPAQPLLAIETLRAAQTRLTLGPDGLEIPDLRLDKVATRLLIAADQSVNIVKLLRTPPAPSAAEGKPAPATDARSKPDPDASAAADPFPVVISRVRLDHSVLEFADFSLKPQFDTRMHELQGVITGISTSADTRARMELDARVDEFGSAQIRGVMNLFKPHVFTNVTMIFRNLEMSNLTPYAAKFAGYRIASGKLSMDLQYRIKNNALVGENKIVIDKLALGERVESPTALDVPLELAIAILKDENGRIDLGVPVSGSLEDPQFSIAAVVWKAIGNILGRIVTAPFRALAGLFGGGKNAEELSSIEFDPGVARLLPQERQKLQTVAEALAKRPELKLTVKPAYAPKIDREALQSIAVRRAVLARAGIKLAPDEAPGPLDYGNSRIRSAIEDVFTDAFGFPAARDLRANLPQRKPTAQAAADSKPPQAPKAAAAPLPKPAAGADANAAGDSKPVAETATGGGDPKPATETATDGGDPKPPPEAAAVAADSKPATKPPEASNVRVARAMARRLIEARPVEDAALSALARERGETVAAALRDSAKVDPARIATAAPQALEKDADRAVETTLELGVAK